MIPPSRIRHLLGLPTDGTEQELATAFAEQAGLLPPSRESTVHYLVTVLDCMEEVLLRDTEYLFESAEAAYGILGRAQQRLGLEDEGIWIDDLKPHPETLQDQLAIYLGNTVIPKMARAGLIQLHPPPSPE